MVDNELIERCDRLRLAGRLNHWSLKRFREMVFEMGMDRYDLMFPPPHKAREYQTETGREKAREETRLKAAGCETAPETAQRTEAKIIPFPGVSIDSEVTYQNALDDFLREIGYID
jgi:hypothetical protein